MSAHFPSVANDELGYDPSAVDPVIDLARSQFADPASHVLDAKGLRTSQFPLAKGGYQIGAVDSALDRLDDAFAEQEAHRLLVRTGEVGARTHLAQIRDSLIARSGRGRKNAFNRQSWWQKGYSVKQVDAFLVQLALALNGGRTLEVGQIRQVTFAPKWAGYNEAQVDAALDRAVQYFQISKHLG